MENKTAELVTLKISVMPNPILSERGRLYNDNLSVAEISPTHWGRPKRKSLKSMRYEKARFF